MRGEGLKRLRHLPLVLSLDWDWFVGIENGGDCLCCLDCPEGRKFERKNTPRLNRRTARRPASTKYGDRWSYREDHIEPVVDIVRKLSVSMFVVANSHGHILRFLPEGCYVLNLDLHEDKWEEEDQGECAHWGTSRRIRRFRWFNDDYGFDCSSFEDLERVLKNRKKLDLLFLALSTPHTARSDDSLFFRFVRDLSRASNCLPTFAGNMKARLNRGYRSAA